VDVSLELGPLMAESLTLRFGDREFRVNVRDGEVFVDGQAVQPARHAWVAADRETRWVFVDGNVFEFELVRSGRKRATAQHGSLTAPMPATVRKILVQPGSVIHKGETLLVLEAMKMELPVRAPSDGVVQSVACREGELVQPGVVLVKVE
jgi:biotin carboxyl carrier protein